MLFLCGSFKLHMAPKETFLSVYPAAALQSVQELRAGRQLGPQINFVRCKWFAARTASQERELKRHHGVS